MCVLAVITRAGTTHGYEIVRTLHMAGLGEIKGGTLYPVIARLEEQGLIDARWVDGAGGPGRKLVTVTDKGRTEHRKRREHWHNWTDTVAALIDQTDSRATTRLPPDDHPGSRVQLTGGFQ